MIKNTVRSITPPIIWRALSMLRRHQFYGFSGNYSNWDEAAALCGDGYASSCAIEKSATTARNVPFSRLISNEVLWFFNALNFSLLRLGPKISIVDFGGGLGGHYRTLRPLLPPGIELNWTVVELPPTVEAGGEFANSELHFTTNIPAKSDLVIASGVLQYCREPSATFASLKNIAPYLLLSKFPLGDTPRLTIQTVHPSIFDCRFPAWIFSHKDLSALTAGLDCAFRWDEGVALKTLEGESFQLAGALYENHACT